MNVFLIGGSGTLINSLIIKYSKEGHRVSLLTGDRFAKGNYQRVFERYDFPYEHENLREIFESIRPNLTIFLGAYDTNFKWGRGIDEKEAVRYGKSLINILMACSSRTDSRLIYLSSQDVYGQNYSDAIEETQETSPVGVREIALAQAEEMCESYRRNCKNDNIMTVRMDNLYGIPERRRDVNDICTGMCLEALEKKTITVHKEHTFSMLYMADAVEFLYRLSVHEKCRSSLYNFSSGKEFTEESLAELIRDNWGDSVELVQTHGEEDHRILSSALYESEFGNPFFCDATESIQKIIAKMKKDSYIFLTGEDAKPPLRERIAKKLGWLARIVIPFIENFVVFLLCFFLTSRGSGEYFSRIDFYLLYVLLFAICYGQQQATVSGLLAVVGYCFLPVYGRSGDSVMLDASTYIWIAQLFILGLSVGYLHDQIAQLKRESEEEKNFLNMQFEDIWEINSSNIRVKDALETQIVNQSDSVGKIYSITSALDQYSPDEVLFYAAEVLGNLLGSKDVAIYTVSNRDYARLFSATSSKARELGNSVNYTGLGELYETLAERKVYINRRMDENYPLMANAIFDNDEMQMIVMVWGLPWEKMTLGQANQLVVISALIQNAVLRANRYFAALEEQRYVTGTRILEREAFRSLVNAYLTAKGRHLTECTLLRIETGNEDYLEAGRLLTGNLRQTDSIGILPDGKMYALLANAGDKDAEYVIRRFENLGYKSRVVK